MDNVYCPICGPYNANCIHQMCDTMRDEFGNDNEAAGFEPCDCESLPTDDEPIEEE